MSAGASAQQVAGRAKVELSLDNKMQQGLRKAQAQLKAFGDTVGKIGTKMAQMSAVMAVPFAIATKTFMAFNDQMKIVEAVTSATKADFSILNETAKKLGATTSFTASQVASAMVALGRAGFNTNEILSSIAGTLDLARAGALDLGEATTIMADVSRAFGITADNVGRVGDVLAKTANISNTDVRMVGESMKYVAASANISGQSLEDISSALAVMANRGLKAEMAGASLAMALSQLAGDDVQKTLNGIGVSVKDAEGNMRSLVDIMSDLNKATAGMGNADKLALFKNLFDQRGMRSTILLSENIDEWKKLSQVVSNSAGTASSVATKMDSDIGGSFRRLMSAAEGVQIAISEALTPALRSLMGSVTSALTGVVKYVEANKDLVVTIGKLASLFAATAAGFLALNATIRVVTGSIWLMQKAYAGVIAISTGLKAATVVVQGAFAATISFGKAISSVNYASVLASKSISIFTSTLNTCRETKLGLTVVANALKLAISGLVSNVKLAIEAFNLWRSGAMTLNEVFSITYFGKYMTLRSLIKGVTLALGNIAIAAGVAIASFKLGEKIAEWTGLTEKIKDAYFWLFNIKELNDEGVESKQIEIWKKQLDEGKISAEEFETRIKKLQELKLGKKENPKEFSGNESSQEVGGNTKLPVLQDAELLAKKQLQIRELELEVMYKGFDLEQKKLDLAKQEEILSAKGQQQTLDLIEKEYALRQQILDKKREEVIEAERMRASEDLTARLQDEAERVLERSQAIANFDNEQEMRNEELMLELQYKGFELERQKLALAEKRAIAEAEKNDYDVDAVKQEFDLRKKILNAREIAEKTKENAPTVRQSFGTFSSQNLQQVFGSGSAMDRIAKFSEETAKNTKAMKDRETSLIFN